MVEVFVALISIRVVPDVSKVVMGRHFYDDLVFELKQHRCELLVIGVHEQVLRVSYILSTRVDVIGNDEFPATLILELLLDPGYLVTCYRTLALRVILPVEVESIKSKYREFVINIYSVVATVHHGLFDLRVLRGNLMVARDQIKP
jgi:hypothetical protein